MQGKIKTIRPTCAITCGKYNRIEQENKEIIKLRCDKCRDRDICGMAE